MKRCINIDWLEIYCLEDLQEPITPDRLTQNGEMVVSRDYGTRIYKEMFTVYDHFGDKCIEVRRNPASIIGQGGVLPINACHIRLVNRYCYANNPVDVLRNFISKYNLTVERISRIDICLDFERFDYKDIPQRFVQRYIKGKFTKVNQANVSAHGTDTWEQRTWNSLSWGSLKSPIGTKLYNKTLELQQVKDKPYIRQAWFESELVDDPIALTKKRPDGQLEKPTIWRLEFSIRSPVKNWVTIEKDGNARQYRSIRNTLDMYDSREKLLAVFASLVQHYFHFKVYKMNKTKYECPDKLLFNFSTSESYYSVEHPSSSLPKNNKLMRLRLYLEQFGLTRIDPELKRNIASIIRVIDDEEASRLLADPYNKAQLKALRLAVAARFRGSEKDITELVDEILEDINKCNGKLF